MNSRLWPVAKSSWRPPARTAAAWPARRATTPTSRPWNPGNHHHIHLVDMVRSNFCHRQAFGLVRVVHLLILLFLDATYFYQFPFSSFDQLEKFRSFDRDPSKKSLQKTISLVVVFRWILNRLDGCFGLISSWSWVNVGQRYRVSWCSFNRVFFLGCGTAQLPRRPARRLGPVEGGRVLAVLAREPRRHARLHATDAAAAALDVVVVVLVGGGGGGGGVVFVRVDVVAFGATAGRLASQRHHRPVRGAGPALLPGHHHHRRWRSNQVRRIFPPFFSWFSFFFLAYFRQQLLM